MKIIYLLFIFLVLYILFNSKRSTSKKSTNKTNSDSNNKMVPFKPIIDYYVINLERRKDRRHVIQQRLDKFNIHRAKFVKAIDGHIQDLKPIFDNKLILNKYHNYIRREFRKGEVGCYISHYNVWEMFKNSNADYGIVFEDDIVILDDFNTKLPQILEQSLKIDWDILYIGRNCIKHYQEKCAGEVAITDDIGIPKELGYGAFAYVINKKGVKKIMKHAFPAKDPTDDYFVRLNKEGLIKAYVSKKDIVTYNTIGISDTWYENTHLVSSENPFVENPPIYT